MDSVWARSWVGRYVTLDAEKRHDIFLIDVILDEFLRGLVKFDDDAFVGGHQLLDAIFPTHCSQHVSGTLLEWCLIKLPTGCSLVSCG